MTKKLFASVCMFVAACGGDIESDDDAPERDASSPMMDAATGSTGPSARMDATTPEVTVDAAVPDAGFAPICNAASPLGCLSGTGERNGKPYDCPAASWTVSANTSGAGSWVFACDDAMSELTVRLEVPTSDAGAFAIETIPGDPGVLTFAVRSFTDEAAATLGSMTEKSSNLIRGRLSGVVGADSTLHGAFDATWDTPMPGCVTGYDESPCTEGSLHLSFHVMQPVPPPQP